MIPLRLLTTLALLAPGAHSVSASAASDTVGVLIAGQGGIIRADVNLAIGAMSAAYRNQFQPPNETMIQLNAAGGSVCVELHRQRWGHCASDWIWHDTPVEGRDILFVSQANAFLNQIEGKPARTCSLEAAIQTLRFNLAALASAEQGRRIFCPDLT